MGAEQAFDQNLTTRWASEPEDGAGAWIEVAFASDVTVEQFNIYENKAWGNVTGYNVQCFVNGEWKTVYEGTETSPDVISLASPEKTNRVRVNFTAVAEDRYQGVTLWEMGVFGIGPEIETPPESRSRIPGQAMPHSLSGLPLRPRFAPYRCRFAAQRGRKAKRDAISA